MQGKIVKGIAGFYYVHVVEKGIYSCKAKGIFRKQSIKPLVGDNVTIAILDEASKEGSVTHILKRSNELIRPAVANIDQALVIFSIKKPNPNLNLLDKFLIMMEREKLKTIICFNKTDISSEEEQTTLQAIYETCGYPVIFTSTRDTKGMDELVQILDRKTTAVAGPSGVGKSSIINVLQPNADMETGELSEKLNRGKHTTRHSELIYIRDNTYIMDTPGFSSLEMKNLNCEDLKTFYREFSSYEEQCRFQGCIHIHEPRCAVKEALEQGKINQLRYDSYKDFYEELKGRRRY